MDQVQIDEHGAPEVLHLVEVPDPVPGPGQVLIEADAIGITFIETQMRAGRSPRPGGDALALPAVLGNGVEGHIVAVGDGVDPTVVGSRVVTATGGLGGYSQRVVVGAADPIAVPSGLAPGEAVALLADGRTALALVRAAALTPTDRVLVTAAAGGVGSLLVQLAAAAGVDTVIALAGGANKVAVATELGADVAVDYTADGWPDAVRARAGSPTVVFDGVGGDVAAAVLDLVEPGGRYVLFGAASGAMADAEAVTARAVDVLAGLALIKGPDDNRALVVDALDRAAARTLRPLIGQRFPLADAAAAHAAIEARATRGKTLLIP